METKKFPAFLALRAATKSLPSQHCNRVIMDRAEHTLDPQDWGAMRRLGHTMIDDMMDHLQNVRSKSVWRPITEEAHEATRLQPLPVLPQGFESTYASFKANVLAFPAGSTHPRFWGWVQGTGTPFAMLADMLASGLNPHMAGFNVPPTLVEEQVVDWLKEMFGFSTTSTGYLTSGGTMANMMGLAVARHHQVDLLSNGTCNFRLNGFQGPLPAEQGEDEQEELSGMYIPQVPSTATEEKLAAQKKAAAQGEKKPIDWQQGKKFTVYASAETHKWAKESMELLGFGSQYLRLVPVIPKTFRIHLATLRTMLESDRRRGLSPLCIIGNCGTVNTGAVDDLVGLASICKEQNLWFHVDGAFGALALLSPKKEHQSLVQGLELCDSVAFDLHKWGYMPYEVGCILIRPSEKAQLATFSSTGSYITAAGRGMQAHNLVFSDLGFELTRGFKALKVWMSFKAHGVEKIGQVIGQNIEQCRYFAYLVVKSPLLALMAPVNLNIVCFRYQPTFDALQSMQKQKKVVAEDDEENEDDEEEELADGNSTTAEDGEGSMDVEIPESLLDEVNRELLLQLQESGAACPSGTTINGFFVLRIANCNHRSMMEDFAFLAKQCETLGSAILREKIEKMQKELQAEAAAAATEEKTEEKEGSGCVLM